VGGRLQDVAHEPLVSDDAFEEPKSRSHVAPAAARPTSRTAAAIRTSFKSLIHCDICKRRMQGQYAHGVAYYRCRF
jgi:site-specific DNA recombinase